MKKSKLWIPRSVACVGALLCIAALLLRLFWQEQTALRKLLLILGPAMLLCAAVLYLGRHKRKQ